jgi:uroporphyrinogen decarboxylase
VTPRERAIAALTLQPPPPGLVPTFELEFQLTEELLGKAYHWGDGWPIAGPRERERLLAENAALYVEVAERLDYCILMVTKVPDEAALAAIAREIRRQSGDRYLLVCHGDATYAIPDGGDMEEVAAAFFERPDAMKGKAAQRVEKALERGRRLLDAGYDGFALCADYCFNEGPFLSPRMFAEFVTPYLARLVMGYKAMGAYVIKHTDGNIMPILDQLVSCEPHGLHALDCQARDMDLAVIKRLAGDKVCLIGGVQCGLLQTGTEAQIVENCRYALRHGMPGGGYIYGTTNVAFKGLPLERYLLMLQVRAQCGGYP